MIKYTEAQIIEILYKDYYKKKIYLLAPLVRARKGHYRELFESLRKKGFLRVRIDGQLQEVMPDMRLDRYKIHDVELVVDRLEVNEENQKRLVQSLSIAMAQGNGLSAVIEKDGSISNAEIIRSSGFQLLDIEAMRAILNMPNWTSGKQNGDSVRVKFALPITFKLQ
jgi:TonB family protein